MPTTTEGPADADNWTVQEVAKLFRVSVQTVRNRIADGKIKSIRFGARQLIPGEEVARIRREGV